MTAQRASSQPQHGRALGHQLGYTLHSNRKRPAATNVSRRDHQDALSGANAETGFFEPENYP